MKSESLLWEGRSELVKFHSLCTLPILFTLNICFWIILCVAALDMLKPLGCSFSLISDYVLFLEQSKHMQFSNLKNSWIFDVIPLWVTQVCISSKLNCTESIIIYFRWSNRFFSSTTGSQTCLWAVVVVGKYWFGWLQSRVHGSHNNLLQTFYIKTAAHLWEW